MQPLKVYSTISGIWPKRSYVGIYDQTILCSDCEKIFQPYDDYAQNVFIRHKFNKINESDEGYFISDVSYDLIKLFFVSVLWRAHASSHDFYNLVDLESLEDEAKKLIRNKNPGDFETFSVIVFEQEFTNNTPVMMKPARFRRDGARFYEFPLGKFKFHIKIDKTQTGNLLFIRPNTPIPIPRRPFDNSPEKKLVFEALENRLNRSIP